MKKTNNIILLFILIMFASCGPKRLGCGPRRCEIKTIDIQKIEAQKNPELKSNSGLV